MCMNKPWKECFSWDATSTRMMSYLFLCLISSAPKDAIGLSLKYFMAKDGWLAQILSNALQGLKNRVTLHPCLALGCSHFAPYCYYSTKSFPSARQHFTHDWDKYTWPCEAEEMKGNTLRVSFFMLFFLNIDLKGRSWIPIMGTHMKHPGGFTE